MAIRRELHHLLDEVLDDDPRRALIAVRLGRSRQSLRERYRLLVPSAPPGTGAPDHVQEWQRMHDGFRRLREFEGDDVIGW